VEKWEVVGQVI